MNHALQEQSWFHHAQEGTPARPTTPTVTSALSCSQTLSFDKQSALTQHTRHRHVAAHNSDRLQRIENGSRRWLPSEEAALIKQANWLLHDPTEKKRIYEVISRLFPKRSTEDIKKRLARLGWEPRNHPESSDSSSDEESTTLYGPVNQPQTRPPQAFSSEDISHDPA